MITAQMVKELRETSGAGMLDCKKALEESNGNFEGALDYLREKGISKASKKADRIAAEGLALIKISEDKAIILEVNSETDFVSKNEEFIALINLIADIILKSNVTTLNDALNLSFNNKTINDLIIEKTSTIGEKISLRRFEVINKINNQSFGSYLHMGGKIASLIIVENANEEVANEIAMQTTAMKPSYIRIEDITKDVIEHETKVLTEQTINEGKTKEIAEKMVIGRLNKFYKEICLEEQSFIKDDSLSVKEYVKNNGGKIIAMIRYEVGEGMEKRNEDFAEEVMKQVNN